KQGDIGGGDPFAEGYANLWEKMISDETVQEAGGGYWDINKNFMMSLKLELTNLQNLAKAYYMTKLAKGTLEQMMLEELTGVQSGGSNKVQVFSQALSAASSMEADLFTRSLSQIQQFVNAHNEATTAMYDRKRAEAMFKSCIVSLVLTAVVGFYASPLIALAASPVISGITDYVTLSYLDKKLHDKFTPNTLEMNKVYDILGKLRGSKREVVEAIKEGAEFDQNSFQAFFAGLDKAENAILAQLDGAGMYVDAGDGFQAVNEKSIMLLRGKFESIQNARQAYLMIQRAKMKTWNLVYEIMTGKSAAEAGIDLHGAGKAESADKMLELQMKVDTIHKKVIENNRQRQLSLQRQQALYSLVGSIVGIAVGMIACAAVGIPLAINSSAFVGVVGATISLGNTISSMLFQKQRLDRMSTNVHADEIFYEQMIDKVINSNVSTFEKMGMIDEMAARSIDDITQGAAIDIGDGMWGLDIGKVMQSFQRLNALRTLELALLSVEKSRENVRKVLLAYYTGTSGDEDFEALKIGLDARMTNRVAALEAKIMMVNDEINMHNQRTQAEKAFHRSMVQLCIELATLAFYGVKEFAKAGQSSKASLENTFSKGNRLSSVINAVVNTYYAYSDSKQGMGMLDNFEKEKAFLKQLYKQTSEKSMQRLEQSERDALMSFDMGWIQSVGHGQVSLNMKYVSEISNKIDKIYNAKDALANIMSSKARMRAHFISLMGGMAVQPADYVGEAFTAQREMTNVLIEQMTQKLQDAITRMNDISNAKKNLIIQLVSDVVIALDSTHFGKTGGSLEKELEKSLTKVIKPGHKRAGAAAALRQMMVSQNLATLLGTWIYDKYYVKDRGPVNTPNLRTEGLRTTGDARADQLGYYEYMTELEGVRAADGKLQSDRDYAVKAHRDAIRDAVLAWVKEAYQAYFEGKDRYRQQELKKAIIDFAASQLLASNDPATFVTTMQGKTPEEIEAIQQQYYENAKKVLADMIAANIGHPGAVDQVLKNLNINIDPTTGEITIERKSLEAFTIVVDGNEITIDPTKVDAAIDTAMKSDFAKNLHKPADFQALKIKAITDELMILKSRIEPQEGDAARINKLMADFKKELNMLCQRLRAQGVDESKIQAVESLIKNFNSAQDLLDIVNGMASLLADDAVSGTIKETFTAVKTSLETAIKNEAMVNILKGSVEDGQSRATLNIIELLKSGALSSTDLEMFAGRLLEKGLTVDEFLHFVEQNAGQFKQLMKPEKNAAAFEVLITWVQEKGQGKQGLVQSIATQLGLSIDESVPPSAPATAPAQAQSSQDRTRGARPSPTQTGDVQDKLRNVNTQSSDQQQNIVPSQDQRPRKTTRNRPERTISRRTVDTNTDIVQPNNAAVVRDQFASNVNDRTDDQESNDKGNGNRGNGGGNKDQNTDQRNHEKEQLAWRQAQDKMKEINGSNGSDYLA
ncbi:MAG: hypothetical protein V1843_00745, partial [bacterium]